MLIVWLRARGASRRGIYDVSRIPFTVRPRDLDVLLHMNNGTYLTMQDLGRYDWMLRTGTWALLRETGWSAVVARQTITYRASLHPGDRYLLETRFIGVDERNFYIEHRFVRGGEICAQSFVVGRFTDRDGAIPMDRIREARPEIFAPHDLVPDWVRAWGEASRLPSARNPMPSEWTNRAPRD